MIDFQLVREKADLYTLAGCSGMKKVATSGGGEWAGPCPKCGGKDRFRVQPYHSPEPRWMCRTCTAGDWKNAIDLGVLLWPNMKASEICERIMGGNLPTAAAGHRERTPEPAYAAPGDAWQTAARNVITECEARLWQPAGAKALAYLRGRGIQDETIKHFRLGFNDQDQHISGDFWLDRGVTIPCEIGGCVWYVKVRRATGEPKYRCMGGSKPAALYNAADLVGRDVALFCEGEFDCMIAWQELEGLMPIITIGGAATNKPDLATWGAYLLPLRLILAAYDNDEAGQAGAERLAELAGERVRLVTVPSGKDINDFHKAGGDVYSWALDAWRWHEASPEELAGACDNRQYR